MNMKQSLTIEEMKQLVRIDPTILHLWDNVPEEVEDYAFSYNKKLIFTKKNITNKQLIAAVNENQEYLKKISREKLTEEMLEELFHTWWVKRECIKEIPNLPKSIKIKLIENGNYKWEELNHQDQEEVEAFLYCFPKRMKEHPKYLTESFMEKILKEDINEIQYLTHMPKEWIVKKVVTSKHKIWEETFKNLPKEVKVEIVKKDSHYFDYLSSDEYEEELTRILFDKGKFELFRYLEHPTEVDMIKALRADPSNLQYIQKPNEKIQLFAVTQDEGVIQYLEEPTLKVVEYIMKKNRINGLTKFVIPKKAQEMIVKIKPKAICYLHPIDLDIATAVIESYPDLLIEFEKHHIGYPVIELLKVKKRMTEQFFHTPSAIYQGINGVHPFEMHLDRFVEKYYHEINQKKLKELPLVLFEVWVEGVLVGKSLKKTEWIKWIETQELNPKQNEFWKKAKTFHSKNKTIK